MRITRETLLKLAQETVAERVRADRGIMCAFVTGSLLGPEPLIGGTTDIDLVLIHDIDPFLKREIVRLSPEVHLDIAHHAQATFRQPRHLRQDFRLGSLIDASPILLHDTQHWFEFTQASIRSQFWEPDNVLARARSQAEAAREAWLRMQTTVDPRPERVERYLEALEQAANAIASLTGRPLTERRMLIDFPARAQAALNPGLVAGLAGLIGATDVTAEQVRAWLPAWEKTFQSAAALATAPANLNLHRLGYYQRAIDALLSPEQDVAVGLWPLLKTWTQAVVSLSAEGAGDPNWREAVTALRLDPSDLSERLSGLDVYLDSVEETLDRWASANGI